MLHYLIKEIIVPLSFADISIVIWFTNSGNDNFFIKVFTKKFTEFTENNFDTDIENLDDVTFVGVCSNMHIQTHVKLIVSSSKQSIRLVSYTFSTWSNQQKNNFSSYLHYTIELKAQLLFICVVFIQFGKSHDLWKALTSAQGWLNRDQKSTLLQGRYWGSAHLLDGHTRFHYIWVYWCDWLLYSY